jgi:hypothetical protein
VLGAGYRAGRMPGAAGGSCEVMAGAQSSSGLLLRREHAMTQQPADAGRPRQPGPRQREPGAGDSDEWPDDRWPGDTPGGDRPGGPAGPAWAAHRPAAQERARPGWPRRAGLLAVTAVAAAAAGALVTLGVRDLAAPPATAAGPAPAGQPALLPGGPGGPVSGLPGGASGAAQIMLAGTVTAVSRTSITIGGPGRPVTGAVTSATRVTGKVTSISGVRPGDHVSAQFTQDGGETVAAAIQDPARAPGSGTLP